MISQVKPTGLREQIKSAETPAEVSYLLNSGWWANLKMSAEIRLKEKLETLALHGIAASLREMHELLVREPTLGTFLRFSISMDGKPRADYTHGSIDFDDFSDLANWVHERTTKPK